MKLTGPCSHAGLSAIPYNLLTLHWVPQRSPFPESDEKRQYFIKTELLFPYFSAERNYIFQIAKTVGNYFDILQDLLIAVRIPVFTRRAKRRMIAHSKFYYFDAGIYRTLRPAGPLDAPEEIAGSALETLCFQELRAINDYFQLGYNIYFWRTGNGLEVDFILYGPRGLRAFEIKHSSRFSAKDLRGLRAFAKDYPQAQCYFLYMGSRREFWEGIEIIPIPEVLRGLLKLLE